MGIREARGYEVTGRWDWLTSSPMADSGIRDVESSGSANIVLLKFLNVRVRSVIVAGSSSRE